MFAGSPGTEASARAALARARVSAAPLPQESEGLSLIVDLAAEPVGPRWIRGVATLALLCGAALALGPGIDPFSSAVARTMAPDQQFLANPMLSGPIDGAGSFEAELKPLAKPIVTSDSSAIRVQGSVTEGLYWSLRSAGVSSQVAADYLKALSSRIDVGADVAPYDRFDLVVSKTAEGGAQPLLYAALHRVDGPDVELLKWTAAGRADWFDTDASGRERSDGLMAPVAGRITSGFGMRDHP